jgi:predicted PurR-regulated permease PerM
MERERVFYWVLIVLLLVLLYFSFLILQPYLTSVVVALVLAYLFHPIYRWFAKRMPHAIAALLMIVLILLLIFLPAAYIVTKLVSESIAAYNSLSTVLLPRGAQLLDGVLAMAGVSSEQALQNVAAAVRDYSLGAAPVIISSVAATLLGLFVVFFLMYFAFIDGEAWVAAAKEAVPMMRAHKERLFERIGGVTHAVMYGQFLTALIQGAAGGLMFFVFGVPNPVFWGFIMVILSFIPLLGTPLVWLPAAIIELLKRHYVAGFGLLIVGGAIMMIVDNLLRPRLISGKAQLSTPLVLLGVLGGLQLFGLIGLILGPLILALLQTTLAFFHETTPKKRATR